MTVRATCVVTGNGGGERPQRLGVSEPADGGGPVCAVDLGHDLAAWLAFSTTRLWFPRRGGQTSTVTA